MIPPMGVHQDDNKPQRYIAGGLVIEAVTLYEGKDRPPKNRAEPVDF
jgi:hypothetical protein